MEINTAFIPLLHVIFAKTHPMENDPLVLFGFMKKGGGVIRSVK
jgi:hypothetical protein